MTLSRATTKSIILPTIRTSASFVYNAPEKKVMPMRGTVAKGKRKSSSEKWDILYVSSLYSSCSWVVNTCHFRVHIHAKFYLLSYVDELILAIIPIANCLDKYALLENLHLVHQ